MAQLNESSRAARVSKIDAQKSSTLETAVESKSTVKIKSEVETKSTVESKSLPGSSKNQGRKKNNKRVRPQSGDPGSVVDECDRESAYDRDNQNASKRARKRAKTGKPNCFFLWLLNLADGNVATAVVVEPSQVAVLKSKRARRKEADADEVPELKDQRIVLASVVELDRPLDDRPTLIASVVELDRPLDDRPTLTSSISRIQNAMASEMMDASTQYEEDDIAKSRVLSPFEALGATPQSLVRYGKLGDPAVFAKSAPRDVLQRNSNVIKCAARASRLSICPMRVHLEPDIVLAGELDAPSHFLVKREFPASSSYAQVKALDADSSCVYPVHLGDTEPINTLEVTAQYPFMHHSAANLCLPAAFIP